MRLSDAWKHFSVPRRFQTPLAVVVLVSLGIQHFSLLAELWHRYQADSSLPDLWVWFQAKRESVVPLATGVGGFLALLVAFGQFKTARLRHEEQTRADLQRRITESFSKATEQLGSDKLEVRLGGIYTLERISKETESPETYWTVMETLTAFVRERARWKDDDASEGSVPLDTRSSANAVFHRAARKRSRIDRFRAQPGVEVKRKEARSCPTDIQAAMTVIGRRDKKGREQELSRGWRLNLRRTDLRHVDLRAAQLEDALFNEAHLEGANLSDANLKRAMLTSTHLEGAILMSARLDGAYWGNTNLSGAILLDATGIAGGFSHTIGDGRTILSYEVKRPSHWPPVIDEGR